MDREEYKRKALEPIVSYIESVMASYSKEELEARIKEALPKKESEDERIKRFILTSLNYLIGIENSPGSDYDKQLKEAYSWLEKQKENPKTADSISSDCTSDAKCEDRWHKVGDFLPDDAREVLCKDAIGNFFIGRYYKCSNSWEVSMYDDVEKTNEDNPPVVMWTDIPSEKQKEQKPAEWSEEDKVMLDNIIWRIHVRGLGLGPLDEMEDRDKYKKYEDFLKSLPERFSLQPHWKPTKEQMEALYTVLEHEAERIGPSKPLELANGLYDDLKSL